MAVMTEGWILMRWMSGGGRKLVALGRRRLEQCKLEMSDWGGGLTMFAAGRGQWRSSGWTRGRNEM